MTVLYESFQLTPKDRLVALVGGGGKTAALYGLCREAAAMGLRAALLTTTHVGLPTAPDVVWLPAWQKDVAFRRWQQGQVLAVGPAAPDGRMLPPDPASWASLQQAAQVLFVEADGSKGLPLKYPDRRFEPMLPPGTDRVLLLCGLSCLDQPLDLWCHRADLARRQLRIKAKLIDEALMARILAAGYGDLSPFVVINQADNAARQAQGQHLQAQLAVLGLEQSCVLSLRNLLGPDCSPDAGRFFPAGAKE